MTESEQQSEMTAVARAVLQYLADRHKQAIGVAKAAEWTGYSLPKTQAGFSDLRDRGFVRYFPGHPGTWAVTSAGYREVDVGVQSTDRYRMALESIVVVNGTFAGDSLANVQTIARKALGL